MSFQPIVPTGGIAGWKILNRTMARQSTSFEKSAVIQRESAHFREKIASVHSAKDLVADRQLLKVALGAFGLDEDIDKGYFIRRVLEEGTIEPQSFANRLVDKRYAALSDAFGFGSPFGPRTGRTAFPDEILSAYIDRQFEIAVGDSDENMRLAMAFRREIGDIASGSESNNAAWFSLLANPPLRKVLEYSLNLPSEFSSINIDRQVSILKTKTAQVFGGKSIGVFQDASTVETVIERFLARAQLDGGTTATTSKSTALTILTGGAASGSGTLEALFSALYN